MGFTMDGSLTDRVTEFIANKIIKMEYKPGDKIIESRIAAELGLSHSPIREALRVLEKNRLVELIPRKGAYVTEITESYAESLYEILIELLVLVIKKSIQNATDEDLAKLDTAIEEAEKAAQSDNIEAYYNAIIVFCVACLSSSHDQLLEQIISGLLPSLKRLLYPSFPYRENSAENLSYLQEGARHLKHRDADMAEKTLRELYLLERKTLTEGLKAGDFFQKS
jgi:DNA-binding GntR family transcriptional regulator